MSDMYAKPQILRKFVFRFEINIFLSPRPMIYGRDGVEEILT